MCDCDLERPELIEYLHPKARKLYYCKECNTSIFPGQSYTKVKGLWDGDFATYKICDRCWQLGNHCQKEIDCFCWGFGLLQEEIAYSEMNEQELKELKIIEASYCSLSYVKDPYYEEREPPVYVKYYLESNGKSN